MKIKIAKAKKFPAPAVKKKTASTVAKKMSAMGMKRKK